MTDFIPPSPEELNDKFPNFEVESFIAKGGMGAVYLGRQISLDRPVAIKILPPELSEDKAYLASFESEAKALAKLNHTNLVGIFDFGQLDGMFYIIMEYVPGRSLYYTAHGQAVDELEAGILITDICKGLAHAHEHDILHRDIKPANILIDDEARPMIVDFGLAQPMSDNDHEGVIFGTPGYTAPEAVANPHNVDHRSDIFSVGVMLYELLTGTLPGDPLIPASELNDTDPRFDKIIQKAINPLLTLRFTSCDQMAKALDSLIDNFDDTEHPVETGTKILATAAATGAAKALLLSPSSTKGPTMRAGTVSPAAKAPVLAAASGGSAASPAPPAASYVRPAAKKSGGLGVIIAILIALICIAGLIIFVKDYSRKEALKREQHKPAEAQTKPSEETKEDKPQPAPPQVQPETPPEIVDTNPQPKPETRPKPEVVEIPEVPKKLRNGPRQIDFDVDAYLKKGHKGVKKLILRQKSKQEQEYLSNIKKFQKSADKFINSIPRKYRVQVKNEANALFKGFKQTKRIPEELPEDTIDAIKDGHEEALRQQNLIDKKEATFLTNLHQRYLDGLKKKTSELIGSQNFIEAKALEEELERVSELKAFRELFL